MFTLRWIPSMHRIELYFIELICIASFGLDCIGLA